MPRLKILTWHVHGSYLNALSRIDHDWYVPTKPGNLEGYGGRGATFDLPDRVREVPAEQVRDLDLDVILYQSPKNYFEDSVEILTPVQRALPALYLEHNTPRPDPVNTRHPIDDPNVLLIHVTHFNRLMWDSGETPSRVIEHSVALDPSVRYRGNRPRGALVTNSMQKRPRITGYDIFDEVRKTVPVDAFGMGTEEFGGHGDVPYRGLHARVAEYRFLFSPIRYTSLPLSVVEAMTIGMPVVALATTELPSVIHHGETGFVSCNIDELVSCMHHLLRDPVEARRIGDNARVAALERFGLERFIQDWNQAFDLARRIAGSAAPHAMTRSE